MSDDPRKMSMSQSDVAESQNEHMTRAFQNPFATGSGVHPPAYTGSDTFELDDIPLEKTSAPASGLGAGAGAARNSYNFGFYKPKEQNKWPRYVLGLAAVIVIGIIAASTTFAIKGAVPEHQGSGNSTTKILTLTKPTSGATLTETSTVTPLPPPDHTSIPVCWGILKSICSNNTRIPEDRASDGFGACTEVYRYFYCGLITNLQNSGNSVVKDPNNLICANFLDFCMGGQPPPPQTTRLDFTKSVVIVKTTVTRVTTGATVTLGDSLLPFPMPSRAPIFSLRQRGVMTTRDLDGEDDVRKTWIK